MVRLALENKKKISPQIGQDAWALRRNVDENNDASEDSHY